MSAIARRNALLRTFETEPPLPLPERPTIKGTMDYNGDSAKAFNLGSDARLNGETLEDCPFPDDEGRASWEHGWRHVNTHWPRRLRLKRPGGN